MAETSGDCSEPITDKEEVAARSTPDVEENQAFESPAFSAAEFRALRERVGELEARLAAVEAGAHTVHARAGYEPYPPAAQVQPQLSQDKPASAPEDWQSRPSPLPPKQELSSTLLIAAAGAFIFLLGAAFFLFWSIERGYLSPLSRIVLGLLMGTTLVGVAERLMGRGSPALGNSLFAAGVGTQIFGLYYGAMMAQLFAPRVGLAAVGVIVVVSALLAVRRKNPWVFTLAYGLALVAPMVFATGGKNYVLLASYLVVLQLAATGIFYVTKQGGDWHGPRVVGLGGTWLVLVAVALDAEPDQAVVLMAILVATLFTSLLWTSLPRHPTRPRLVAMMWLYAHGMCLMGVSCLWGVLELPTEGMGGVLLVVALLNLVLVPQIRLHNGDRSGDPAPLAIVTLATVSSVPVMFEIDVTTVLWAGLALGLSSALVVAEHLGSEERVPLRWVALPVTALAGSGWLYTLLVRADEAAALWNVAFADGVLVSVACALLTKRLDASGLISFASAELVAHIVLGVEAFHLLRAFGILGRSAFIASTVICAISASAHFVFSFRVHLAAWSRRLAIASYVLFGFAALKLLLVDLHGAGMVVRALATLAVGVIFIATALLANRLQPRVDPS